MALDALPALSLRDQRADPQGFARAMGQSYARFGFAIVRDHGLDADAILRANRAMKAFFALPLDVKMKYRLEGGAGQRGYVPLKQETAKGAPSADLKEFLHVGRELDADHRYRALMPANLWPREVPGFRQDLLALYHALDAIGGELLTSIALFLGLKPGYLTGAVKDGDSVLRLLHYPPMAPNPDGVRAGAHEDINVITLLLGAEEAGLQLMTREGSWLDINPPDGALVVNIGDMLSRLTNELLPSTTHRVVNPGADRAHLARYSIPFFLHFAPDFLIETAPPCISGENPNRYPTPITARDFLFERLREIKLA